MKTFVRMGVALLLLAAAVPLGAQERPADERGARTWEFLRRHRAELELSDAQMRRLEEVRTRLEARNRPLRERLSRARLEWAESRRQQMLRLTPEQRRDTLRALRRARAEREVPAPMRALMEELRVNALHASEEARAVLTDEQKLRARELMRAEARQRRIERRDAVRRELRRRRPPPGTPRR